MQAEQVLVVTSKLAQGSPPELAAALHPWKFPQKSPKSGLQGQAQSSVWQVAQLTNPSFQTSSSLRYSTRQNPGSSKNLQLATLPLKTGVLPGAVAAAAFSSTEVPAPKGVSVPPLLSLTLVSLVSPHEFAERSLVFPTVMEQILILQGLTVVGELPPVVVTGKMAKLNSGELGATYITLRMSFLRVSVNLSRVSTPVGLLALKPPSPEKQVTSTLMQCRLVYSSLVRILVPSIANLKVPDLVVLSGKVITQVLSQTGLVPVAAGKKKSPPPGLVAATGKPLAELEIRRRRV